MRDIQVYLTPDSASHEKLKDTVCVVVDILRATSCWVTALANGAISIHPVTTLEACRKLGEKGYLTAAERGGEKINGFNLGNSPFEYTRENVEGKKIAVTTTNGSRALRHASQAGKVYIGSFLNIDILAGELITKNSVSIVCSGWEGGPGLEDILFAGELVNLLSDTHTYHDDASLIAMDIFRLTGKNTDQYIRQASHVKRLFRLGLGNDFEYCMQKNIFPIIPILHLDEIVLKSTL